MSHIPVGDCVDRGLYRVFGRNISFGVYKASIKGFVGIRTKFGNRYLDTEYHYDEGAPHGTAFPKEFLEMCPIEDLVESHTVMKEGMRYAETNQPLFDYLEEKRKQYHSEDD